MTKNLIFKKELGKYDYYEFKPTPLKLFYINYERLSIKTRIRFLLNYFRGYKIYYMFYKDTILGYCMVSHGGGCRYKFSNKDDVIIGPYYIREHHRGKGYSNILLKDILNDLDLKFNYAYDYIRKDNIASIKTTENNGFKFYSYAIITKFTRAIKLTENSKDSFLVYKFKSK